MSDDKKEEKPVAAKPVGKQYRGQQFPPITTEEEVAKQLEEQKPYLKEGAISFVTYCGLRNHRDPVLVAAMGAFTNIRMATPEDWDAIFEKF
jgi:hypothetical protein